MSGSWQLRLAAVATSIGVGAVACSEGSVLGVVLPEDEDAAAPSPIPEEDASTPEAADAGIDDGGSPRDSDADVTDAADAGKTCTSEGWCHVVVPGGQTLRALWADGQGTAWTVSEEGNILRWNGTAWVQSYATGAPLFAIWGSGPTDLWAGGGATSTGGTIEPGILLHGTGPNASAITWTEVTTAATVQSIWGTSGTDVYAVVSAPHRVDAADPSQLLHYAGPVTDGSSGWTVDPVSTAFPAHFDTVWGTSADDVWLAGRVRISASTVRGQVVHRIPNGEGEPTWRSEQPAHTFASETTTRVLGISATTTRAWLVGFSSTFDGSGDLHTGATSAASAPFTWTTTNAYDTGPGANAIYTGWAASPSEIWFAGQYGRLRRWDGQSWRIAAIALDGVPVQKAIHAVWGAGPNDIWAVGADIALHKVTP